ncbi:S1C family serine protease [Limnoglobus roseus]|uniref:PDZ domain-containing protein n=1 Tax=Limnoglobus roseus TaxID=2598579 RepID=A0A5C1AT83_9BACT|nr:PDZ domain-containing protein [Limnoglobus roseus]QEL20058.1 PDZ domain-containing protein [Limnoglobus roseus]
MLKPFARISMALLAFVLLGNAVFAESFNDGKKQITKLFTSAVAKATAATVRIRCDNRDVVLGTVVDKSGLILTKGSDLKGVISVRLADGSEYEAKYLGYHEPSDLALLRIDAGDVPAVGSFADAKDAAVGNWVAVTSAEAEPVAVGIVSAGSRKLYGEESLIDNLNKGFLGITAGPAKNEAGEDEGIEIGSVTKGGGAAFANLKPGDIILQIAGKPVKKFEDMKKVLDRYKPSETVKLLIRRGDEEKEYKVKLVKKAAFDRGDYQNTLSGELSARRTGFPKVIMHDTAIKPTECGGPLVDLEGHVLGINIARAGRVETWTLPADVIKPILADLKAGKYPAPTDGNDDDKKVNDK